MRPIFYLVALLISSAFVAGGAAAQADQRPDLGRGASLYSENCGRCHNPRGPNEFSDYHWPIIVTHMRVIAGLPGDQARSIEAFLRASNNPAARQIRRPPAPDETLSLSGAELLQKMGCRGCHKIGGNGGMVGPSLEGVFGRRTDEWIHVQIQTPREHNAKTVMPQFGLSSAEVDAIVQELRQIEE